VTRRFLEHTGEVEVLVEAPTEEEVFAEAARAFAELVDRGGRGEAERRAISLTGSDRPSLLVDWVNELVFLAEADGFVPDRVEALSLGKEGLRATVAGRAGVAPANLVKAATYSGLELGREEDGWRARMVLDV
jgi:SHS2 domain-containing protein